MKLSLNKITCLIIALFTLIACTPSKDWEVVGYVDNEPAVYEGKVLLEGTFIMKPQFIDDFKPHIQIDSEFTHLLPRPTKTEYLLPISIDEAKNYETGDQLTIIATRIEYAMEGSPIISFSEISSNVE